MLRFFDPSLSTENYRRNYFLTDYLGCDRMAPMSPEDRARLQELQNLRNNIALEIETRSRGLGRSNKFKEFEAKELQQWFYEVYDKIETIIEPYERSN